MKTFWSTRRSRAFTVLELFIVVVTVFLAAALILPAVARPRRHHGSYCVNNLKQVGLAFRLWSGDNGDMYPMQALSKKEYGLFELNATNGFRYFQVMSNELSTPKIL